jgi:putative SOS response-associated peptidase YedK
MPVILPEGLEEKWLSKVEDEVDIKGIEELIQPYPEEDLETYTVARLRGKEYKGNVAEISEEVSYPELSF